jgi:hypothetical protein
MLDLLQTIGVLLKLFAFGVLAVTSVVVVYALSQWGLHKSDSVIQGKEPLSESNRPFLVNITVEKRETIPFCVPGPTLRKAVPRLNRPKTRDLSVLANKVHERQRREKSMSKELSVNTVNTIHTTVCAGYQRLLEECQRALEIWNEHRAELSQSRLIGKETGDELLRLQAKYARAYTVLQNHVHNCLRCQLVSRIEGCDTENNSDALSDSKLYV